MVNTIVRDTLKQEQVLHRQDTHEEHRLLSRLAVFWVPVTSHEPSAHSGMVFLSPLVVFWVRNSCNFSWPYVYSADYTSVYATELGLGNVLVPQMNRSLCLLCVILLCVHIIVFLFSIHHL